MLDCILDGMSRKNVLNVSFGSRIHWTLRDDFLSWSVENCWIMDGFRFLVADYGWFHSSLEAKHVNKKATKKHADRRPKKHRMSDIVRKPVVYPETPSVPEYTISDAPASPAAKPE